MIVEDNSFLLYMLEVSDGRDKLNRIENGRQIKKIIIKKRHTIPKDQNIIILGRLHYKCR